MEPVEAGPEDSPWAILQTLASQRALYHRKSGNDSSLGVVTRGSMGDERFGQARLRVSPARLPAQQGLVMTLHLGPFSVVTG